MLKERKITYAFHKDFSMNINVDIVWGKSTIEPWAPLTVPGSIPVAPSIVGDAASRKASAGVSFPVDDNFIWESIETLKPEPDFLGGDIIDDTGIPQIFCIRN